MTGEGEGKDAEVLPLLTPRQRAMVERALPMVDAQARWYARRYAGLVERDELVAAGSAAVVEAVRRYDEAHGVSFEGYARARMDGSMLDLIRAETQARQRDVAMRRAMAALSEHHQGGFDLLRDGPEEIQGRLQEFCDALATVGVVAGVAAMRRPVSDEEAAERVAYVGAIRALGEAFAELPEDEQRALGAVFVDGMDMHEAEAFLGVAYVTVRRRLERGRERLRKALWKRGVKEMPLTRGEPWSAPVLRGVRGDGPEGGGAGGTEGAERAGKRGPGPRGR
ncbi:sigma-70 family RNA polymerase sigma factor [Sorangium sp. So ce281]|uniref:sigma-70 family RNA polymerase sigma factor n=1 Tax=unclassified Sorangium TaxID=2621164 RepID=UPI003F60537D